jgi:hypothetical protein
LDRTFHCSSVPRAGPWLANKTVGALHGRRTVWAGV